MTRKWRRRWKLATLAAALALAALLSVGGVRAAHGLQWVERATSTVRTLEPRFQDLQGGPLSDPASLQGAVALLERQLDRAKGELTPFVQLSPLVSWLPAIGPKLRSAKDMLALGVSLVDATQALLIAVNSLPSRDPQGNVQLLQGNRLHEESLRSLTAEEPLFRSALSHLARARATLGRLERRALPSDFQEMAATAQRITPDLEALARTGLAASQSWQSFFGYDSPRTYLVVAQNSDELRATGGFIPGAWVLTLELGQIAQLQFWDTVDVDDPSASAPLPPEGLLQSLWGGAWLFRDAPWYPDFPTTARVIEQMFKLGQGTSFDGVIALNQWAVQEILDALGEVTLPSGERLDAPSYMQVLEEKTDAQGRGFIDTVLQALLDRLRQQGSSKELWALLAALNRSLDQKQMLLHFHDPLLQEMTSANGWDGALVDRPQDYLMVVDSNVGFSKVNRNIDQRISYEVDLSQGRARARLDLLYTNTSSGVSPDACRIQASDRAGSAYPQLKNTCYWDYLRVYAPAGSSLEASSPFPMPQGALYRRIGYNDIEDTLRSYSESGKMVFAGLFTVEVGESRRVAFAYDLPAQVVQGDGERLIYTLFVQKQPGTRHVPVEVLVRLPAGYRVHSATPGPRSMDGQEVRFALKLDSDATVKLILEND